MLLTASNLVPSNAPPRTVVIPLRLVLTKDVLAVDPIAIATHLDGRMARPSVQGVTVMGDGHEVWLYQRQFRFVRGAQQRRVIVYLEQELRSGRARIPSAEVIGGLDLGSRRIRDVFKDNPAWGELLDERGGTCGFCFGSINPTPGPTFLPTNLPPAVAHFGPRSCSTIGDDNARRGIPKSDAALGSVGNLHSLP